LLVFVAHLLRERAAARTAETHKNELYIHSSLSALESGDNSYNHTLSGFAVKNIYEKRPIKSGYFCRNWGKRAKKVKS